MLATLFLLVLSADPVELHGKVIHVTDGDTIVVLRDDHTQIKIRLDGIDAPEKKQPFGTKATERMKELTYGKDVVVKSSAKDRYGRVLGVVSVDGTNVNEVLVAEGLAWQYKRFSKDETLARLERKARQKNLGLWSDPNPVEPWRWRKSKLIP